MHNGIAPVFLVSYNVIRFYRDNGQVPVTAVRRRKLIEILSRTFL